MTKYRLRHGDLHHLAASLSVSNHLGGCIPPLRTLRYSWKEKHAAAEGHNLVGSARYGHLGALNVLLAASGTGLMGRHPGTRPVKLIYLLLAPCSFSPTTASLIVYYSEVSSPNPVSRSSPTFRHHIPPRRATAGGESGIRVSCRLRTEIKPNGSDIAPLVYTSRKIHNLVAVMLRCLAPILPCHACSRRAVRHEDDPECKVKLVLGHGFGSSRIPWVRGSLQ